jgi:hypothetical protein
MKIIDYAVATEAELEREAALYPHGDAEQELTKRHYAAVQARALERLRKEQITAIIAAGNKVLGLLNIILGRAHESGKPETE